MSTLSVPNATDLNQIGMFGDEGLRLVEKHLPILAKIFMDYKMNDSYAIGYLHRHFDIPKSSIWVHEHVKDADRVVPKDLKTVKMSKLQAHSYCLEKGELKAYEYEGIDQGTRPALDSKFLVALKDTIQTHGLEDVVALCPREKHVMFETLLDHEGGTTASPIDITAMDKSLTTEDAQWWFDTPTIGPTTINAGRKCTVNVHGFHFVHEDSNNVVNKLAEPALPSGPATISSARKCTVNVHGFHFVHEDTNDTTNKTTESSIPTTPVTINSQRKYTVNVHGFHFVHDDSNEDMQTTKL